MSDETTRAETAVEAARAGGTRAMETFRDGVAVETKADKYDIVTEADHAAQSAAIEIIRSEFSADPIVAEEGDAREAIPEAGTAWVVDPIDGTANYVRGLRLWTTSVAAIVDRSPVGAATILPAMEDTYRSSLDDGYLNGEPLAVSDRTDPETFAVAVLGRGPSQDQAAYTTLSQSVIERFGDMRRFGSMQAALAFVASGELDAAVTSDRPHPWDSVAGAHLIEQAGGRVTDGNGNPWRLDSELMIASNGQAHGALIEAVPVTQRS